MGSNFGAISLDITMSHDFEKEFVLVFPASCSIFDAEINRKGSIDSSVKLLLNSNWISSTQSANWLQALEVMG